jgi:alkylation response protein AidB-like acyl-CoA dehydrogenase
MNALEVGDKDLFPFEETYQSLRVFKTIDPYYYREMKAAFDKVRRFAREKAAPMALHIDRELRRDPENKEPIWEFARLCGQAGMFTLLLPRNHGGGGLPLMASPIVWEELCAVCSGEGNVVASHYLGYAPFYISMKLRLFDRICREIVEREKSDKPTLLAMAWTEPLVGSDNLQKELISGARIGCEAKPVDGGWVLNGTKCFISDGSLSTYHVAIMPVDRKRPLETLTGFLVPTEAEGFSFGRDEHKMGMKATPASIMIYEDCYLPDEYRLTPVGGMAKIYNIMGAGTTCVGAISTGVARGAYERAVTFAREHKVRGKLLINHEWAQFILAEMLMNVLGARAIYMDAAFCSMNWGFGKVVPPRRGGFRFKLLAERYMATELAKKITDREEMVEKYANWAINRFIDTPQDAGYGAFAKVKCSDYAMTNASLGIDLMGKAGLRHDRGMEKIFRDAKLLQIYEGTNELNRLALFNHLIARKEPGIEIFGGGDNG